MFTGFGFSIKIANVDNMVSIIKNENKFDYYGATLPKNYLDFGLYYKGFGINYAPPIFSATIQDDATKHYSKFSGFQTFYFAKWWGIDIYSQKALGYYVGVEPMLHYIPNWSVGDDYRGWGQEMNSRNQSLNFYLRLLGKRALSDYFFQPAQTRKSKIALFGVLSLDKRKVSETNDFIILQAKQDFSDIYDGFTYQQYKGTIGLGLTATFYLWKFYLSGAYAFGYGISNTYSNYFNDTFSDLAYNFDAMQLKIFTGLQTKAVKYEAGVIIDADTGTLNENYNLQFQSTYMFFKATYRFPSKYDFRK
jgi:hypothetical protein